MSGPISIALHLPDGSAIGVDEDGNAYKGTPVAVAPDELGVWTIPADDEDGPAFHRITHRGSDIVGWGTLTRKGYLASIRQTVTDNLGGEDADPAAVEAELEARWQAEVATGAHQPQPEFSYRTFDWVEV